MGQAYRPGILRLTDRTRRERALSKFRFVRRSASHLILMTRDYHEFSSSQPVTNMR
jgi:hypothetical protein